MRPDETGTRSTVGAIVAWNRDRDPALVREKYDRMRGDLFAFFRGTNHLFAADWEALAPADPGPPIWVCGDLHPKNFGCFRSDEGATVFDINDFDEAVVAPAAVDLVRCTAGIILAGEVWGHSPVRVMRMVLAYLDGYRAAVVAMARPAADADADPPRTATHAAILALKAATKGPIARLIGASGARTQVDLLDRLTRLAPDGARSLKRPGRFYDLPPDLAGSLVAAVEAYGHARGEPATFRVVDLAGRVAGIGSLGVRRYAALVAGDGLAAGHRVFDIKEATAPSFRESAGLPAAADSVEQARRIVAAQRLLQAQPTAGLDVLDIAGVGYCLRELVPEENRARLDQFHQDARQLRRGLDHAGWITAHAHLRGAEVDADDRTAALVAWVGGPALDGVLAAAVRVADRNRGHYKAFRKAKLDPTA